MAIATQTESPDSIPAALQSFTQCMVAAAKATHGVRSATRGVTTDQGKAFVFVRYAYIDDAGYEAVATYSRSRDAPLEKVPLFGTWLPGASPACDVGKDGKPNCDNVKAWVAAEHAHGPIPSGGSPKVAVAWRHACGVATWSMVS